MSRVGKIARLPEQIREQINLEARYGQTFGMEPSQKEQHVADLLPFVLPLNSLTVNSVTDVAVMVHRKVVKSLLLNGIEDALHSFYLFFFVFH